MLSSCSMVLNTSMAAGSHSTPSRTVRDGACSRYFFTSTKFIAP